MKKKNLEEKRLLASASVNKSANFVEKTLIFAFAIARLQDEWAGSRNLQFQWNNLFNALCALRVNGWMSVRRTQWRIESFAVGDFNFRKWTNHRREFRICDANIFLIKIRDVATKHERRRKLFSSSLETQSEAKTVSFHKFHWMELASHCGASNRLSTFSIGNSICPCTNECINSVRSIRRITHVHNWIPIRIVFTLIACSPLAQYNFRLSTSDNYYD